MTIISVKTTHWVVGYHYCSLWRCHSLLYKRHTAWKPLGWHRLFQTSTQGEGSNHGGASRGWFCSGKILKNAICCCWLVCFWVCSFRLIVFCASEGSSWATFPMAKASPFDLHGSCTPLPLQPGPTLIRVYRSHFSQVGVIYLCLIVLQR